MEGKRILVTGGTGTFGQTFVKEILTKNPAQVRVFSRDELKQSQMASDIKDKRVDYLIGDVRDYDRLKVALRGVDIVVHAAAMKRVEACNHDPQEAVKTNVLGTQNVLNACMEMGVTSGVFISSDKAVLPTTLYGATKLLAEQIWLAGNVYRGTTRPFKASVVRYGNVCNSRGSIGHLFKKQMQEGVIKITDQRMTRFFLPIQEAVDLVQLAIEIQQGGEIFLPQLKASSIMDVAYEIAGKLPVEIIGNRGSEKLHEVLATEDEFRRMATFDKFCVVNPDKPLWAYVPLVGQRVSEFHTSETAERLTQKEIRSYFNV